jgi:eukaryotic-like serine/threonine-protein kinase
MSETNACPNCGYELGADDRFCPQCGTPRAKEGTPRPAEGSPWVQVGDRLAQAVTPRYRVVRPLGFGGMAAVFMAEEPRLGRRVAIKVMAPNLMADPGLVGRFIQEARTTAQLAHPNIVTIYDVDERDGLHYFVMAYVAGRTLGELLQRRDEQPLPMPMALSILAQAGNAIAYAHRVGIVHRDMKPGNILIDGEGNALVTDFGIAKVIDQPGLTQTGMLVGTPAYMSPEQCGVGEVTGASDQYSLGVVAYEMMAGRPPFTGTTMGVLHAHVHGEPPPLTDARSDCPPEVSAGIMRMLAKTPGERFPTVADALAAMGAVPLPHDDPLRAELGSLAAAVDAVRLSVAPDVVRVGDAFPLSAVTQDESGRRLAGRTITWSSSDETVAEVTETGRVRAVATGTATIVATCEGVRAAVAVEVEPGEPAIIEVVPPSTTLGAGQELKLQARIAGDPKGTLRQSLVWRTSDPRIAAVTDDGRVEALRPGSVVITAVTGQHEATAVLTVTGSMEAPWTELDKAEATPKAPAPKAEPKAPTARAPSAPPAEKQKPPPAEQRKAPPAAEGKPPADEESPLIQTDGPVWDVGVTELFVSTPPAPPSASKGVDAPAAPPATDTPSPGTPPAKPSPAKTPSAEAPPAKAPPPKAPPVKAPPVKAPPAEAPPAGAPRTARPADATPSARPAVEAPADKRPKPSVKPAEPRKDAAPKPAAAAPVKAPGESASKAASAPTKPRQPEVQRGRPRSRRALLLGGLGVAAGVAAVFLLLRPHGGTGTAGGSGAVQPEMSQPEQAAPGATPQPATGAASAVASTDTSRATGDTLSAAAPGQNAATPSAPPSPAGAQPAALAAPASGRVRLASQLPAGAEVTAVDSAGHARQLSHRITSLPAGRYAIEVTAPGYETAHSTLRVGSGRTVDLAPTLKPVQKAAPPPTQPVATPTSPPSSLPAPPSGYNTAPASTAAASSRAANNAAASNAPANSAAADRLAAETQISALIRRFADSMASRNMNQVSAALPGLPGDWVEQWKPFIVNKQNVQNLSVRVGNFGLTSLNGDVANVEFSLQFDYSDYRNKHQTPSHTYDATLRRVGAGWALTSLSAKK